MHGIPNALIFSLFAFLMSAFYTIIAQKLLFAGFHFPPHAGYPLGTAEDPKYVVMETHYDNPDKKNGEILRYSTNFF